MDQQNKVEIKVKLTSHKGYIPLKNIFVRYTNNFKEGNPHWNIYCDKPIVDIETVNIPNNSTNFEHTKIGMVGIFYKKKIFQIFKTIDTSANAFIDLVKNELSKYPQPFYAWNSEFDSKILKDFLGVEYEFKEIKPDGVNISKRKAVEMLNINVFDPIKYSKDCIYEYFRYLYFLDMQYLTRVRLHNQACLMKEYYLLKDREKLTKILSKQSSLNEYK